MTLSTGKSCTACPTGVYVEGRSNRVVVCTDCHHVRAKLHFCGAPGCRAFTCTSKASCPGARLR